MDHSAIGGDLLEMWSRESSITLDRDGHWHQDGQPVTHERLQRALHQWLDRDEESGRYVLRAGEAMCFITVEDAPFVVRRVRSCPHGTSARYIVVLSDGTEEVLNYETLEQSPTTNVLYCQVKSRRFTARFDRSAYFSFAENVELDEESEQAVLKAEGGSWPISMREPAHRAAR